MIIQPANLLLFITVVCATACSPDTAPPDPKAKVQSEPGHLDPAAAVSCGGETTRAKAEEFFADLKEELAKAEANQSFIRFVAPSFWVRRSDKRTVFDRADFNAVTPRFLTMDDWREIERRGLKDLENLGYRGCLMDHGKVWIDAYGEQGLLLRGINHDMPWVE